jgi:hypothetical protein
MSDSQENCVVQRLITSFFTVAEKVPVIVTLSSDLQNEVVPPVVNLSSELNVRLLKDGIEVTHISSTPQSQIGKKRGYFGTGSSTLDTTSKRWERCESNTSGGPQASLTVDSPLELDCESVNPRRRERLW